jgi:hypothetical protein
MHRLVDLGGQALEDVRNILRGVDAFAVAVAHQHLQEAGTSPRF